MKKQIITLVVAALLLSSCGIYTKYERPEVKTDGLYGQDVEVEDTTSIASLSWRASCLPTRNYNLSVRSVAYQRSGSYSVIRPPGLSAFFYADSAGRCQ